MKAILYFALTLSALASATDPITVTITTTISACASSCCTWSATTLVTSHRRTTVTITKTPNVTSSQYSPVVSSSKLTPSTDPIVSTSKVTLTSLAPVISSATYTTFQTQDPVATSEGTSHAPCWPSHHHNHTITTTHKPTWHTSTLRNATTSMSYTSTERVDPTWVSTTGYANSTVTSTQQATGTETGAPEYSTPPGYDYGDDGDDDDDADDNDYEYGY